MLKVIALTSAHIAAASSLAQTCAPVWRGHAVGGPVNILHIDREGPNPVLYLGGDFQSPAPYLAAFDGQSFSPVGQGLDGEVLGLTMHDDGTGRTLYVSGSINVASRNPWTHNVARLEDGIFRAFGDDDTPLSWIGCLMSFDTPRGSRLAITGGFGFPCSYTTQWTGSGWECLGAGLGTSYQDATIYDDGTGPAVFFTGGLLMLDFPFQEGFGVGKWDGQAWHTVGNGINGVGAACAVFDDGSGPELFVAGAFTHAGTGASRLRVNHIAKWNGHRWSDVGGGFSREATSLAVFNDGSGAKLYAAGAFTSAGNVPVDRLARWDGAHWTPCPAGGLTAGTVSRMTTFDPDGDGPLLPRLILAGGFQSVGGVPATNFAELFPASSIADFNTDGFVDHFDYAAFVHAFDTGAPGSDINHDGFLDFFDYGDFVSAFESGC